MNRITRGLLAAAAQFVILPLGLPPLEGATLQPGDYGSFSFPIENIPGRNRATLLGARIEISTTPSWFIVDRAFSQLGPVNVPPGETVTLRLDFVIGPGISPQNSRLEIDVRTKFDNAVSAGFLPASDTWHISSKTGMKTFRMTCTDDLGNPCGDEIADDTTPPITEAYPLVPFFQGVTGNLYLSTNTPVILVARDTRLEDAETSDLAFTGFALDAPTASFDQLRKYDMDSFRFAEGQHSITMASRDKAGHVEEVHSATFFMDATPPVSLLSMGTPQTALSDGSTLVSTGTPFIIISTDPVSNGVASGVKHAAVAIDTNTFQVILGTFTLSVPDGLKTITFFSRDNVDNAEVVRSTTVVLDSTPPQLSLASPRGDQGLCSVVKGKINVLGSAEDLNFRSYALESAPGRAASSGFTLISSGTAAVYSGILGSWDAGVLSGFQTLRLTATDLVDNVSVLTANVFVGDPALLLTLGGKKTFQKPEGAAVGGDGRIYVADSNNDRIAVFTSTGGLLASFGGSLDLNKPRAVAVDGQGNVFIADTNNSRVLKLSPQGSVLLELGRKTATGSRSRTSPGKAPGEFNKPSGLALDASGNIYVSDTNNHRVQKFSPAGAFLSAFDLPPAPEEPEEEEDDEDVQKPELGEPAGIALDGQGNIYVADKEGDRALKFGPEGRLIAVFGLGLLEEPRGIAVDPDGECLLVSDGRHDRVVKFDRLGNAGLIFGEGLSKPSGLALDASGSLFLADRNNDRVLKLGLSGSLSPIPPLPEDRKDDAPPSQVKGGVKPTGLPSAGEPETDSAFAFRDLYAFPNPARNGRGLTIRIQVGLADEIKIEIYTVLGLLVHRGAAGSPRVLDDGNGKGPQYTYDYRWDTGGAGPGAYLYAITARKAGHSEIRKSGKAAISR